MNLLREKALEKMLDEMNQAHTGAEDKIHNFLCDQTDDKLFEGILKEGKTIKQSMFYCIEQARKMKTDNVVMIDDDTVFEWVRNYFLGHETVIKQTVKAEVKTTSEKPKKEKSIIKKKSEIDVMQVSLF